MQRLTVAGRLLITALVLGAIYFGFRMFGGQEALKKLAPETQTEVATNNSSSSESVSNTSESSSSASDSQSSSATDGGEKARFDYTPPGPIAGKLKGVVELGASGFNSFIIRIDADKNWKLEKAEFGNSLVLENMASDDDIRAGLKKYIAGMLDYGVSGRDIHFVVSSGAVKAEGTQKIIGVLKSLKYFVNTVTPEQEGKLGLKSVQPAKYADNSFVTDIGSGNTKISWKEGSKINSVETYGAKYFQNNTSDETVSKEVQAKAKQVPSDKRTTCFIIGGVPFELAKKVRKDKERYTVLDAPSAYQLDNAKSKAGLNIYKSIADATGCKQFVFDWDANFTIGFLLDLP
ncbi:hypothetical protein LV89_00634 [Arcicella aurantiaca]|uniref:Ppx/GppA phosphatase family protein n=1 Tax=Arcicella aurantiaca TaxID=591202 RepID=A0A316EEK3_9BACT|nr:hypothetical protein [Arcicella aurantiaca]PWK29080.1 hypothetical protein LV89_00634 [Arcicella aurantiaca]